MKKEWLMKICTYLHNYIHKTIYTLPDQIHKKCCQNRPREGSSLNKPNVHAWRPLLANPWTYLQRIGYYRYDHLWALQNLQFVMFQPSFLKIYIFVLVHEVPPRLEINYYGLNGIKLKWIIGTHDNWKNLNPGGCFEATR